MFRDNDKAGVLVYGMGHIGKSSLAARIANRMPKHETVVIYERYDGLALFDRFLAAIRGGERQGWEQKWRERISKNGATLGDALEEMLRGPFDDRPILLVADGLEQILETPRPGQTATPVRDACGIPDAWRDALGGVLRAFGAVDTESRILLTSRYLFSLPDRRGRDIVDALAHVQLRPMDSKERANQWRAAERTEDRIETDLNDDEKARVARVLDVAGGVPRLQHILCRPVQSDELTVVSEAVDVVERWKASGKLPVEESAAQEFFRRVSFETYQDALTETQRVLLRAATLFSEGLPVPAPALEAVGRASGVSDPRAAIERLPGLGLVDGWWEVDGVAHAAANPLARPLAGSVLVGEEQAYLATAAIGPLAESWRDAGGDFPFDQRGVEAARLALVVSAPAEVLERAAFATGTFLFRLEHNAKAALANLESARAKMEEDNSEPSPRFLLLASNCAARIGKTALQIELLGKGLALQSDDKVALAQIAATHAEATISRDGPDKALQTLRDAVFLFEQAKEERSRAVTMGKIADILAQRGETEEALRIHREEELPIFECLGDVGSRAVTMGRITDILAQRGRDRGGPADSYRGALADSRGNQRPRQYRPRALLMRPAPHQTQRPGAWGGADDFRRAGGELRDQPETPARRRSRHCGLGARAIAGEGRPS